MSTNPNGKNTTPSSSSTTADMPIEVFVERYLADVDEECYDYNHTLLYCPNTGKGISVHNPTESPIRYPIASGVISLSGAGTGTPESSQRKHDLNELHTCHACNMEFASLNGLRLHMQSHPAMDTPGGGVRAPPANEGKGKAVQRDDEEVPRNTAASEIIDLTVGDDDIKGRPPANCKFSIDLNKPPPRDDDEDEDEDGGMGDIRPGLVA